MIAIYKQFQKILNKGQKLELVGLFFLAIVGGILETFSISVIIPYISIITEPESLNNSFWGKWILSIFGDTSTRHILIYLTIFLMAAFFLKNLFLYILEILQHQFSVKNFYTTSNKLFHIYINKSYDYFTNHSTSEVITIITNHITKCFAMLQNILSLFTELVVMTLLVGVMLVMNWKITVFILVLVGSLSLLLRVLIAPRLTKIGAESNYQYTKMLQAVKQAFEGIKEIKVMQREQAFLDVYKKAGKENVRLEKLKTQYSAAPAHIVETATIWGVLLFIMFILLRGEDMGNLFTQLTAMGLVVIRLTPCMNRVNRKLSTISFYKAALMKLGEDVQEHLKKEVEHAKKENVESISFEKAITVENLTFRYPETTTDILKDISFEIKKGEKVGIIGASGNGKTTLVDLLMGYWEPTEGAVKVDGQKISDNLNGWYTHIGYIPQMIFMLDGTIFENVAFGQPDADEEAVLKALKQAHLDDFLTSLPDGIYTTIGEKGVRLSGGQRQRIGIARALFHNPDVLIFDEATSALDSELESEIADTIYELSDDKTIIMIAHRHSTLRECDYILEVEDAKVKRREVNDILK